jgi:hypothetical protein
LSEERMIQTNKNFKLGEFRQFLALNQLDYITTSIC